MSGPNLRRATLCSGVIAEQRLRQRAARASADDARIRVMMEFSPRFVWRSTERQTGLFQENPAPCSCAKVAAPLIRQLVLRLFRGAPSPVHSALPTRAAPARTEGRGDSGQG